MLSVFLSGIPTTCGPDRGNWISMLGGSLICRLLLALIETGSLSLD
jgi:hypothetical protein